MVVGLGVAGFGLTLLPTDRRGPQPSNTVASASLSAQLIRRRCRSSRSVGQCVDREPAHLAGLLVAHHGFAGDVAAAKAHGHVLGSVAVGVGHLRVGGQQGQPFGPGDDLGLLQQLPDQRRGRLLVGLDNARGQTPKAVVGALGQQDVLPAGLEVVAHQHCRDARKQQPTRSERGPEFEDVRRNRHGPRLTEPARRPNGLSSNGRVGLRRGLTSMLRRKGAPGRGPVSRLLNRAGAG